MEIQPWPAGARPGARLALRADHVVRPRAGPCRGRAAQGRREPWHPARS